MNSQGGALEGVRVVEFTQLVFGPQCGQMLHDLGAEIVKVERPDIGDLSRSIPISADDRRAPYLHANNRGKRSIALDVETPEGLAVARRLIAEADVLIENLAPGALDRLGLGYEPCAELNSRLVYASGSTFGSRGPMAGRRGADLAGQAVGGLVAATGTPEQPSPVGVVAADAAAGLVLCSGILAALLARERSGRGQLVESSLYGGATWIGAAELSYALLAGAQYPRFPGGHPSLSPPGIYGVYATAEGHIAVLGAGRDDWEALLRALDRPDLGDDPRFASSSLRVANATPLREAVRDTLLQRTAVEWGERFSAEGLRFAPVNDFHAIASDEQAFANGYVVEADDEQRRVVGNPLMMSATPPRHASRPPELGEHTEQVLLELGYDWDGIGQLREAGAI